MIHSTSYTGSTESYDPFSSLPHTRYSPPGAIILESPVVGSHARFQDMPDRSSTAYHSPYATSHATGRSDSMEYKPRDASQPSKILPYETTARRTSQDHFDAHMVSPISATYITSKTDDRGQHPETGSGSAHHQTRRRPLTQDEFDGPSQLLPLPEAQEDRVRAQTLPELPVHLEIVEQDEVMRRYNDTLSACAFHFIAKYQFPVPLEREKIAVRSASDRDWTEWAYLLKRLATKRRIPARILHDNQIKNLVTILENSIAVRSPKPREQLSAEKTVKDDRYILQLISAGVQVARVLMDSLAMQQLIDLYIDIEAVILNRRQYRQDIKVQR